MVGGHGDLLLLGNCFPSSYFEANCGREPYSPYQPTPHHRESAEGSIFHPSALEFCFHWSSPWSWPQVIFTTPSNALSPQAAAVLHHLRPLHCRVYVQWEQLEMYVSTKRWNSCRLRLCLATWKKVIPRLFLNYREEIVLHSTKDFRVTILAEGCGEGCRAIVLKLCLNSGSTDFLLGCVFLCGFGAGVCWSQLSQTSKTIGHFSSQIGHQLVAWNWPRWECLHLYTIHTGQCCQSGPLSLLYPTPARFGDIDSDWSRAAKAILSQCLGGTTVLTTS